MACCGGRRGTPRPGCAENRSCTDILFLLLYLVFLGAWGFVAYLGFSAGDPYRLLYGTDSAGLMCSRASNNTPSDDLLRAVNTPNYSWLGNTWSERTTIWYPMDATTFAGQSAPQQIKSFLKLGICVKSCPVPNGDLSVPVNITSYATNRTWSVTYASNKVLNRCWPDLSSNLTTSVVKQLLQQWTSIGQIGTWWDYVQAEILTTYPVIGICSAISIVLAFVLIFLLRFFVGLVVYLVLILFQLLFLVGGGAAVWKAKDIQDNAAANDPARDYVIPIYIGAAVLFIVALLVFFIIIFMWKRIRVAIEVLKLAGAVMTSSPSILLVPFFTLFLLVITVAWALLVGAYVYTSGKLELSDITIPTPWNNGNETIKVSSLNGYEMRSLMLWFDFFAFLWTMGICNAISFMMVAFVTVMYYFSDPNPGNNKKAPCGAVFIGLWWTLRYHLGTVAFGAFLIAVIQLIRFIVARIQTQLESTRNDAAIWMGRCVQCYLGCLERIVSYINHNAYIITCIKSTNFCRSAYTAVDLIIGNIAEMVTANYLADTVFFFCKAVVAGGNVGVGFVLIQYTDFGKDVRILALSLVIIGFISYIIAAIIFHLFDTVQDTVLMCYCYDKEQHDGSAEKPYYFNQGIAGVIGKYNHKQNQVVPIMVSTQKEEDP